MSFHYFSNIVGNRALTHRLSKDISENMLSHAYILEGPRGSGRHTVALNVAAAIECERRQQESDLPDLFGEVASGEIPCGNCPACEKILSGKSPDVITMGLEDDKQSIGVETVRQLKNDMYTAPNDLSVKVYIIEDADTMTVQAQNAFLLSLEEPPAYVLFFLLCENSAKLLETVRSRAPTLRTERLESEQVEEFLLRTDKRAKALKEESPEDWKALVFVSSGSIGYALELLDVKKRAKVFETRAVAKELIRMLKGTDRSAVFEAIAAFGTKRAEVIRQLSFLQYAIRDLLLLKKSESAPLCFFEDRDAATELATHFTAQGLFALSDAVTVATDDLESNANVRLTLTNMMLSAGLL